MSERKPGFIPVDTTYGGRPGEPNAPTGRDRIYWDDKNGKPHDFSKPEDQMTPAEVEARIADLATQNTGRSGEDGKPLEMPSNNGEFNKVQFFSKEQADAMRAEIAKPTIRTGGQLTEVDKQQLSILRQQMQNGGARDTRPPVVSEKTMMVEPLPSPTSAPAKKRGLLGWLLGK